MLWASRNKHTSRHAAATHTKQKRERKRDCVCTQRRKNVGLKKHLIFHCISWAAWRKEGPLFLSKREEEKKTSFQEDSCLSQIDPRAAAAFAISNSPVFVSLRCSCSPPPTQCTLRGRRIRAQLTGRRLCCRRLCIHRRTHTHTGVEYYETWAVFGLFAAVHFGSTHAFVFSCSAWQLEEPDVNVRVLFLCYLFWTKLSAIMFSHSLKVIKLLIVLASGIWRRDKRKKEDLIFFFIALCFSVRSCAFLCFWVVRVHTDRSLFSSFCF